MRAGLRLLAGAWLLLTPWLALADPASLQRGAQMFAHDCASCHSLKYLRYSRLHDDLGFSASEISQGLNLMGAGAEAPMLAPMPAAVARLAFGKSPPDLSLEVTVRGAPWVRQYLASFYLDPTSPSGWNNPLLPNVAMPNPFWREQGIRGATADHRPGRWQVQGQLAPAAFGAQLDDLVAFLQYAAEPAAIQRRAVGPWVLLFLTLFVALAYALKRAFWKDVAH